MAILQVLGLLFMSFWLLTATAFARVTQDSAIDVDAPPSLESVATRIRTADIAAIARAMALAGLELPSSVSVVLIDRDDSAYGQTPPWVVGTASYPGRIVIYPDRIGSYPYDSLEAVLIHELAHVSLSERAAGGFLPRWFHEGVAVSVESGWGIGSQVRLLLAAQRDPEIDDVSRLFASDSLPATTTAYLLSAALIEDIRRRHGLDVPGRIALKVASGETFDQAFVNVTGETTADAAAAAWQVYRGLRWLPVLTSPSGMWGMILGLAAVAFVVRLRKRRQRRRDWEIEEQSDQTS